MGRVTVNNVGGIANLYFQVASGWLQWRASVEDSWTNLIQTSELGGGASNTRQSITASSVADNEISYANGNVVDLNMNANIDLDAKVDRTTIPDGSCMMILAKNSSGSQKDVDFDTNYENNLGGALPITDGKVAYLIIFRIDTVYHLFFNDISTI